MIFFKIIWAIDAIIALIFLYFFFIGLADGTVSGKNGGQWFLILLALGAVLGGSILLRTNGHAVPGIVLLLLMAVPALLFVAYMGIALVTNTRWQ